jgi:hypothetical protein
MAPSLSSTKRSANVGKSVYRGHWLPNDAMPTRELHLARDVIGSDLSWWHRERLSVLHKATVSSVTPDLGVCRGIASTAALEPPEERRYMRGSRSACVDRSARAKPGSDAAPGANRWTMWVAWVGDSDVNAEPFVELTMGP